MTGDDRGMLDGRRRAMLKGLALGAVGAGSAGVTWPHVAPHLRSGSGPGDGIGSQQAIDDLAAAADATHVAAGGRWADASSWEGAVPDDGARVHVPAGTTVTLDHEDDADLLTVRVDGTLRSDPASSAALRLDTLVVADGGTLELGTADAPDVAGTTVEFRDEGPIDETRDPTRVGRGLVTMNGATLTAHGAEKTGFLPTERDPDAGDDGLVLARAPTGWDVGDELVVAGTNPASDEDEVVTVAERDGATVALESPLEYDHHAPAADLSTFVANLDRTVRLASESDRAKRRGHVMITTQDATLEFVGLIDLGRTEKARPFTDPLNGTPPDDVPPNPQARYPCHFHRTGVDTADEPRRVRGCVVRGSPGWGYVNHHSYVEVEDCVAYRVFGAGFVAEVGTEVGSFRRNFALRSTGSGGLPDNRQFREDDAGSIDDFGHGGYGFWLQGPGVAVEENVAAGHRHHGFVYWTRAKPDHAVPPEKIGGIVGEVPNFPVENLDGQAYLEDSDHVVDGRVPSSYVKLRSFVGNTVFASGGGLDVSRHRFGDDPPEGEDHHSVVREFTAFNVGAFEPEWGGIRPPRSAGAQGGNNGVSIRYSRHLSLEDVRLVGGRGDSRGIGINHNHAPSDVRVDGGEIGGWKVGVRSFPKGDAPIRDLAFDNEVDVQHVGGGTDRRWSVQRTPIEGATFADGGRASVYLGTELDDDLYGLFSPESVATLDGRPLYFEAQRPDFVPVPDGADVADVDDDALADLTDVRPGQLVGKTNAALWDEFGISVEGEVLPDDAGRHAGVVGGYLAGARESDGGSTGDASPPGPLATVTTATGSLVEWGRIAQGRPVYVYDDPEFLAVPGAYENLPYLRFEGEDGHEDRRSFAYLRFEAPATVWVALDDEVAPGWLSGWRETGRRTTPARSTEARSTRGRPSWGTAARATGCTPSSTGNGDGPFRQRTRSSKSHVAPRSGPSAPETSRAVTTATLGANLEQIRRKIHLRRRSPSGHGTPDARGRARPRRARRRRGRRRTVSPPGTFDHRLGRDGRGDRAQVGHVRRQGRPRRLRNGRTRRGRRRLLPPVSHLQPDSGARRLPLPDAGHRPRHESRDRSRAPDPDRRRRGRRRDDERGDLPPAPPRRRRPRGLSRRRRVV